MRFKHLEKQGMSVQVPSVDCDNETEHLSDTVFTYAFAWGQAGYLLGVAVGREIGPYAMNKSQQGRA